jgi:hypothetical protein
MSLVNPPGEEAVGKEKRSACVIEEKPPPGEPLPADARLFWNGGALPSDIFGEVAVPPVPAAIVKFLGNFPFWRGELRFLDFLEDACVHGSDLGMEVFINSLR